MKGAHVYKAIHAVMAALTKAGIAKNHTNAQAGYQYRSIDDVLNRLAPLLTKHRLCVLPRVLERSAVDRNGVRDELLVSVTLKVAFDLVSAVDESRHTVEAYGEAVDSGDKATAKAMSAAYKVAMLQTFCVPVLGVEDPDARTYRLRNRLHEPAPPQGWDQWTADIKDMIGMCESEEALACVQNTHRTKLRSLSRERADLYKAIGNAVHGQISQLAAANNAPRNSSPPPKAQAKRPSAQLRPDQAGHPIHEGIHA